MVRNNPRPIFNFRYTLQQVLIGELAFVRYVMYCFIFTKELKRFFGWLNFSIIHSLTEWTEFADRQI